jgi:4-hydroxyphenylpyruvate dioxygenase
MSTAPITAPRGAEQDFMPLNGVDHVELFVGNAAQARLLSRSPPSASSRSPTRPRDGLAREDVPCLEQGRIRLVLTGRAEGDSDIARHATSTVTGVKVIACRSPTPRRLTATAGPTRDHAG